MCNKIYNICIQVQLKTDDIWMFQLICSIILTFFECERIVSLITSLLFNLIYNYFFNLSKSVVNLLLLTLDHLSTVYCRVFI